MAYRMPRWTDPNPIVIRAKRPAPQPSFTLTPQPRELDGSRVRFDCGECGHGETFVRLEYVDLAHVLANDHYWGECPEVHWQGTQDPSIAAHRAELARLHRKAI